MKSHLMMKKYDNGGMQMESIISVFMTSCIPAIISGIVTYIITCKKAKNEIMKLQESNKHEIEKLMKQHEIDIEALKEKHNLEIEKSNQDHKHKLELLELEHKNALESKEKELSNAAMFGVMADLLRDPKKLSGIMELASDPRFAKRVNNQNSK